MSYGTISSEVPGWYIQFQADVLLQLPRPGEVSEDIALGWHGNRGVMKKVLREALLPPPEPVVKVPVAEPKLLALVGTVTVPPRTAPFVPKNAFVVNTKPGPHVKISYVDPDFLKWFGGKAEEPTAESTLRYYVLLRSSAFASAIKEIGTEVAMKTTPGELYSMMEKQPDGPRSGAGPLLTNWYTNLFEMEDEIGVSRLVSVHWRGDGWGVRARPVSRPCEWNVEYQVFSRDSR